MPRLARMFSKQVRDKQAVIKQTHIDLYNAYISSASANTHSKWPHAFKNKLKINCSLHLQTVQAGRVCLYACRVDSTTTSEGSCGGGA